MPEEAIATAETAKGAVPDDATLQRLVRALDIAYARPWLLMWRGFLHGLSSAIGASVGTVLVIVLSGYIAHQLGLFSGLVERIQDTVIDSQRRVIQEIQPNSF